MTGSKIYLFFGLICYVGLISLLNGCVERRLTINTEPVGALVSLNDEEIGISPVTVEFNWYGDYKIRASKQGYEILETHQKLDPPLHDQFPFDLFAEILWPDTIVNEYEWTFELAPYNPPQREELIQAARQMKEQVVRQTQSSDTEPSEK
jgi:hypothetical protein